MASSQPSGSATEHAAWAAIQSHGALLVGMGLVVTLVPLIVATLFARYVLHMNPVITCGALAGAMTVDAAVTGACEVAESQTPVLGVAVPYAIGNVVLTVLGPIIVALLIPADGGDDAYAVGRNLPTALDGFGSPCRLRLAGPRRRQCPSPAIITFAAGRGGRVDGKPNNNCAPDRLVEATADFGRYLAGAMLWFYIENDTFFGPALLKRMHEAFTAAGGRADII